MGVDKIKQAMDKADWQARSIGGVCLLIAEHVPGAAEIIAADLDNPEMSLARCFGALKDYASRNRKGGFWGCACHYWDTENPVIKVVADFYKVNLCEAQREDALGYKVNLREAEAEDKPAEPESQAIGGTDGGEIDLLNLL